MGKSKETFPAQVPPPDRGWRGWRPWPDTQRMLAILSRIIVRVNVLMFSLRDPSPTSQTNPFLFRLEWWNRLMVSAVMCFTDNFLPDTRDMGLLGLLCFVNTFSATSSVGISVSEKEMLRLKGKFLKVCFIVKISLKNRAIFYTNYEKRASRYFYLW